MANRIMGAMNRKLLAGALTFVLLAAVASAARAQPLVGVLGITREVAFVEQLVKDRREVVVRGFVFHVGTLSGRPVVVGRTGPGKVNAAIVTTVMISHFNPSVVLFSGTAGAVDQQLRPGDVVIGTTVAQHDTGRQTAGGLERRGMRNTITGEIDALLMPAPPALLAAARQAVTGLTLPPVTGPEGGYPPKLVEGVIVTGDVFVSDVTRRDDLRANLNASAAEMEGGAMVQACRQFGVPCLVVRSITDRADGLATNSYEQFLARASENAAAVVAAIVAKLTP
jgi:adenosylhomocysteine nucleosidase